MVAAVVRMRKEAATQQKIGCEGITEPSSTECSLEIDYPRMYIVVLKAPIRMRQ
jgi:hypothetical protein